jgi:hypothetical protein
VYFYIGDGHQDAVYGIGWRVGTLISKVPEPSAPWVLP